MGADHHVVLPDGRRLVYADWGDPAGRPVLYLHGGLSCRLDIAFGDDAARPCGVRLIAPDRPGIGGSDRARGRTVASWAADAAALADRLGVERFAVLGWSAGGPFALACAALLPDPVVGAATVGGAPPFRDGRDVKELGLRGDRLLFPLARCSRGRGRRRSGDRAPAHPPAPAAVAGRHPRRVRPGCRGRLRLAGRARGGAPGGVGTIDDYRALGAGWGFDPSTIAVPTTLWQGGDDDLVPIAHARRLAHLIPSAHYRVVPGAGHFLLHDHVGPVLDALEGVDVR